MSDRTASRRALALSGGAVFGAYQAGACRALEESGWRPDSAAGVSIGAVNGWLLSRGTTADELYDLWVGLPERLQPRTRRFAPPWSAQVPMFRLWVDEIVERYGGCEARFQMDLVLLEIPRCRAVVVAGAEAGRDHLLAACALPGVMAPVRIGDKLLVDCGTVRHIPLRETLAAAPDDMVVIDLLATHPFPPARRLRQAVAATRDWCAGSAFEPALDSIPDVRVRVVGHPRPLGGAVESFRWSRTFAERLYRTGYRDASAVLSGKSIQAA